MSLDFRRALSTSIVPAYVNACVLDDSNNTSLQGKQTLMRQSE